MVPSVVFRKGFRSGKLKAFLEGFSITLDLYTLWGFGALGFSP